ncbi:Pentatricopeptide repeat-containing protein [Zostera marina]|uniref:Pentatricopeptide repeat-containing protein n=1 Tax=Zostera marina TaxID=29655 RepID=A0A0K9NR17_ZOSMR|nr:Pentatricopeptide repeat-containing protein [Zostera marina]
MISSVLKLILQQQHQQPRNARTLMEVHGLLLTSGMMNDCMVVFEITRCFSLANRNLHAYEIIKHGDFNKHQSSFYLNSMITTFADTGNIRAAKLGISVYKLLVGNNGFYYFPDKYTFTPLLKSCAKCSGIVEGRQVHSAVSKMGFLSDLYVQNSLLHMYSLCCVFVDARSLFDEMSVRDVVTWTGLISGYVKGGLFKEAIRLFMDMDMDPNMATLVSVLGACGKSGDVAIGRRVHGVIIKRIGDVNIVINNVLLDMYAKCLCLDEAKQVFEEMPTRDILSWTSIITGLTQANHSVEAVNIFHAMQDCGVEPDKVTLASVLSACASIGALDLGRWVHDYIEQQDLEWDVHLGTAMVDMYSKSGSIETALRVFENIPFKNLQSWNAVLGGLAMHGHGQIALEYYMKMVGEGEERLVPNNITFIALLNACSHSGLVEEGRQCFSSMSKDYNLKPEIEHYCCMVDLLGRAGLLEEAYGLIKTMPMEPDEFIWGAMLRSCKDHGNYEISQQIKSFLMEREEESPNSSGVLVILSNIYATNRKWRDVVKTRRMMKQMGIKKEPGSSVIELNGRSHEFIVSDNCCDHMQKDDILFMLGKLANQMQQISG